MLLHLKQVLTPAQIDEIKHALLQADWMDGKLTAGNASIEQKSNLQIDENSQLGVELGNYVLSIVGNREDFIAAALPSKIYPPMFNCYQEGGAFGFHVDNAIRQVPGAPVKVRTDLSMTLFLSDPDEYEGGELIIQDTFGEQAIKLPAGDMVLYPSTSIHKVQPVTKGRRLASFFWLQSMVKDNEQRRLLYQLDQSIQALREDLPQDQRITDLIGVYHNLLRNWAVT